MIGLFAFSGYSGRATRVGPLWSGHSVPATLGTVLTEAAARWVLVLHTGLGVAAVGAATHLVIWLRRYLRGQHGKRRAVLRFAWIVLALQVGAFIAGNAMYPTYKVEVRAAYLENAAAITADREIRARELDRVVTREGTQPLEAPATTEIVRRAAAAARWFDIKEHWISLGIFVSLALLVVLSVWEPKRDGLAIGPIVLTLGGIAAGTIWFGAIVGVLTASWRAV
jgi:hypothetical protein